MGGCGQQPVLPTVKLDSGGETNHPVHSDNSALDNSRQGGYDKSSDNPTVGEYDFSVNETSNHVNKHCDIDVSDQAGEKQIVCLRTGELDGKREYIYQMDGDSRVIGRRSRICQLDGESEIGVRSRIIYQLDGESEVDGRSSRICQLDGESGVDGRSKGICQLDGNETLEEADLESVSDQANEAEDVTGPECPPPWHDQYNREKEPRNQILRRINTNNRVAISAEMPTLAVTNMR